MAVGVRGDGGVMDAAGVESVWRSFFLTRYWVDAPLIEFNTVASGLSLPSLSFVGDDRFVLMKSARDSSTIAHVSSMAFPSVDVGVSMLESLRIEASIAGFETWQFGGDWRHFFPGCPVECEGLRSVLKACGFDAKGQAVFDVERDLSDYQPPCEPSLSARPCTADDRASLDAFLAREFPGRWRTDTMEKFGETPSRVFGLFLDGACEGFAMTQMDGDPHRRAGAVWSHDLGPSWAALGPIGVSKSLRGQGHGHALLAAALCALRDQGARRTIIDWTTLVDFYGQHGFLPAREYLTYTGTV